MEQQLDLGSMGTTTFRAVEMQQVAEQSAWCAACGLCAACGATVATWAGVSAFASF